MITELNVDISDECVFYQSLFKKWNTLSCGDLVENIFVSWGKKMQLIGSTNEDKK
jgi:hypothetical protein